MHYTKLVHNVTVGPVVSAALSSLKEDSLTIQTDQINILYSFHEMQRGEWDFNTLVIDDSSYEN